MTSTVAPPVPVLETPEELNEIRFKFAKSDDGLKDGAQRVVRFLEGIVNHEHAIGNEVVVKDGSVLFVPRANGKEG